MGLAGRRDLPDVQEIRRKVALGQPIDKPAETGRTIVSRDEKARFENLPGVASAPAA